MSRSNNDGRRIWWSRWCDDVDRRAWIEGRHRMDVEMMKNARKERELTIRGEL